MRALAAMIVLALVPAAAAAQDARELLDEGISLREDGRDAEALERFQRAYEEEASPEALAQIALAEQALGRFVDAEAHLREALSGEPDRFVRRYHELLEQALGEIGARLGTLTLTGGIDGAEVRVASEARGQLPLAEPLRVVAGTVHVEVALAGYSPFARDVEVPPGGEASLAVELAPIEPPAPDPEPVTPAAHDDTALLWTTSGIVVGSAGVAALAIAAGLMAVREGHAQARLACSDSDPACRDHFYAAVDFENAAVGAFITGGILLAGGGALLAIGLTASPEEEPSVACLPAGLGVACAGTF